MSDGDRIPPNETAEERAARWRAREQAEQAEPFFVFHIDGSPHYREAETECCGNFGRVCAACGGFQHYQPLWGGYVYKCEDCGVENA
jgi:hypothetical protein